MRGVTMVFEFVLEGTGNLVTKQSSHLLHGDVFGFGVVEIHNEPHRGRAKHKK